MTDHSPTDDPIGVTDPHFSQRLTEAGPIALVIDAAGGITDHDVSDLDSLDDWWQFLTQAIGTTVTESTGTHGQPRARLHLWRSIGYSPAADGDRLNTAATMLMADQAGLPLSEATPVYGTAVLTGFDEQHWLPTPLDHDQRAAAAEALVGAERYAQTVIAVLKGQDVTETRL